MARFWFVAGCLLGFISVAGGAFGAHALQHRLTAELLQTFQTGTRYAMLHAPALLVVALMTAQPGAGRRSLAVAGGAFLSGAVLFTGSLWALALTGQRWLGAVTPLGGLCFLTGWLALARAAMGWRPGQAS